MRCHWSDHIDFARKHFSEQNQTHRPVLGSSGAWVEYVEVVSWFPLKKYWRSKVVIVERNAKIHFISWLFGYKHSNQTAQINGVIHGLPMNSNSSKPVPHPFENPGVFVQSRDQRSTGGKCRQMHVASVQVEFTLPSLCCCRPKKASTIRNSENRDLLVKL